jgi:membrane fusion protein (multidrug efflux system)
MSRTRISVPLRRPVVWLALLLSAAPVAVHAQAAPAVTVAPAELVELTEQVAFNGRAVAVQKVDLRARVGGFVQARNFTEGGMVAAGQVLFELEDGAYRAAYNQIDAQIAAAEAALTLADLERARQAELRAKGTAAQAVLDRAVAEADRAAAEVRRLMAQREAAALDLSYTQITAPFAGRVGLARADVGALVGPESGPLLTLARTDPMTVQFPVPERDLLALQADAAAGGGTTLLGVTLTLADGSTYGETGKIDFADVAVNPGSDTVLIRAVFPNPDMVLRDGALVRVTVEGAAGAPVLTVPQQAIQRDLLGAFVLVVDAAGVVEQRRVSADRLTRGRAVVTGGLAEGEQVITEGVNKARPGATVDAALAGEG